MKKYLVIALLLIPFGVHAASPSVVTLEANVSGSTINYSGTMEDGSTAVMCKLYSSSDEEKDKFSSPVDENAFTGSFNNVADGTYDVACANYNEGAIKRVSVTVGNADDEEEQNISETNTENKQEEKKSSNPKTYDAGIGSSIILLVISVIGIIGAIIYLKKKKAKSN